MKTYSEKLVEIGTDQGCVRGVLHLPDSQVLGTVLIVPGYFSATKNGPTRLFVDMARHMEELGLVVLRFDFRGMGDSDGASGEISFDSAIADILVTLRYLVKDYPRFAPSLVAHSMGCNCALSAIARHDLQVRKLVLIGPDTSGAVTKDPLFSDDQLDRLRKGDPVSRKGVICDARFLRPIFDKKIFEDASDIVTPCLVIYGENDELYDKSDLLLLASRMRGMTDIFEVAAGDHNFLELRSRWNLISQIGKWLTHKTMGCNHEAAR